MNFHSFQYTYAFMNSFCYILVHENASVGTQNMQPTDLIFTEIQLNVFSYIINFTLKVLFLVTSWVIAIGGHTSGRQIRIFWKTTHCD